MSMIQHTTYMFGIMVCCYVNETIYMFFAAMKLMVCRCIQLLLPKDCKEEIRSTFLWSLVSADWEDDESEALLMIMWIRFTFTSVRNTQKVGSKVEGCKEATRSSSN